MREIKFRAWNKNTKKMTTPFAWVNECNLISSQMGSTPTHQLMQYTGLKDKNGVEIYEGDIVEIVRHDGDLRCKSKVCFMSGRWKYEGADEVAFTSDAYSFKPCIVEVVGNIHQNPELLD